MALQQHLPQDRDPSEDQMWGYSLWEFIAGNWMYLIAIIFLLAIFFYARYSWRKRHEK
ncbi:hypothetical protein RM545_16150 [Zunongwangia sp. F260]|uniref:ATP synthase F0 subunit 8 n=1 Tax=Autumnicola lenta TaxID=3075593 RepID=A0ABU3CPF3_9FLAO|nr:hypothetical protein [Zunongwangia sp. F260]MDT0648227.1 hypothetical protein [Zunongwangia sp. F260]